MHKRSVGDRPELPRFAFKAREIGRWKSWQLKAEMRVLFSPAGFSSRWPVKFGHVLQYHVIYPPLVARFA